MSNNITDLRETVARYTLDNNLNDIPNDYYETMVTTCNNLNKDGHHWDDKNTAAALLYAASIDGMIEYNQINTQGRNAIDWAEQFLQKLDRM